eukprot:7391535-Prymnesium_polylepis.1
MCMCVERGPARSKGAQVARSRSTGRKDAGRTLRESKEHEGAKQGLRGRRSAAAAWARLEGIRVARRSSPARSGGCAAYSRSTGRHDRMKVARPRGRESTRCDAVA